MRQSLRLFIPLVLLTTVTIAAAAQENETCLEQIQAALTSSSEVCSDMGQNQACYGSQPVQAVAIDGATDFSFAAPGDLADLNAIDSLQLSPLNSPDEWGVALMQVQVNPPNTQPDQYMAMVLFGEVMIENVGGRLPPTLNGTIRGSANLRSGPGTNFRIVGAGSDGLEVMVDGRNAASTWFHFQIPDADSAWIFGDLIKIEGDFNTLPTLEAGEVPGSAFHSMQAFTFRSGVAGGQCIGAPQDGILVQTTPDQGEVRLQANEVDIRLGSTVFLQAVAGETMTVDVIDDQAQVTAQDVTVSVPAGARAQNSAGCQRPGCGSARIDRLYRGRGGRSACAPAARCG